LARWSVIRLSFARTNIVFANCWLFSNNTLRRPITPPDRTMHDFPI
jgi:hypothetical protein